MSTQSDNRKVVEQFWAALDDGPPRGAQLESWKDTFAEDGVWEMPFAADPLPRAVPGRHLIGHFVDWFFTAAPDLHIVSSVVHETTDPELFILELRGEANLSLNSNVYANNYCTHMRIRNGKVVLFREYFDPEEVLRAFGRDEIAKGIEQVMTAAGIQADGTQEVAR